jgi:hypothetical protein
LAVEADTSEGGALALLLHGSDPWIKNNDGHTVIDLCSKRLENNDDNDRVISKLQFISRMITANTFLASLHVDSKSKEVVLLK